MKTEGIPVFLQYYRMSLADPCSGEELNIILAALAAYHTILEPAG